ncbi:MAG: NosD domain-containing protein [Planctomycetaceae bacterium]
MPGGNDLSPHLWAITGNIIGSQETNVHLSHCRGMTITGNCIYSCTNRNLLIEDSHHLTLSGNTSAATVGSTGWGFAWNGPTTSR